MYPLTFKIKSTCIIFYNSNNKSIDCLESAGDSSPALQGSPSWQADSGRLPGDQISSPSARSVTASGVFSKAYVTLYAAILGRMHCVTRYIWS